VKRWGFSTLQSSHPILVCSLQTWTVELKKRVEKPNYFKSSGISYPKEGIGQLGYRDKGKR
jgi:hypothetical protein